MKNKPITEILREVTEEMCNDYCKYAVDPYIDQDELLEVYCEDCPLNKL